jgi:hypothetical protein
MDAVNHLWACSHCDDRYYYEHHLEDHKDDEGHYGPKYDCETCNNWYGSLSEAKSHMRQKSHFRNHYCSDCQKGFESDNNLKAVGTLKPYCYALC